MKTIYIHGVSERESDPSYEPRLRHREELFLETVTKPLKLSCDEILSAGWGHLRPDIRLSRLQQGAYVRFDGVKDATDRFKSLPHYQLDFRDYLDGAQLIAAPYVEACLFRSVEEDVTSISETDVDAVLTWIAELDSMSATIPAPGVADKPGKVLTTIRDMYPPASAESPVVKFGNGRGVVLKLLDFVRDKFKDVATDLQAPLKQRAQVELAIRWADAIWYVGGPGRKIAQSYILDEFDKATRGANGRELIVVLGHSLGGLISFETINSDEFLEKKLHERGRWALIALGSQLPVYQELRVLKAARFRSELNHRAAFRNIVDVNDPLGFHFPVGETEFDLMTRTGANFISSHTSYLDSVIALKEVKSALNSILAHWREDDSTFGIGA